MNEHSHFDQYWNNQYFYTDDPRYKPFKKLCGLGGDYEYVDFLCGMLQICEMLWVREMRGSRHPSAEIKPKTLPLSLILKLYGAMVAGKAFEAIGVPNNRLSPKQWDEVWAYAAPRFLAIEQINLPIVAHRLTRHEIVERHAALRETITDPLARVLAKYLPPYPFMKGNSQDDSGSFFLLGITEHMRERTKNGAPHHAVAYALLGAVRRACDLEIKKPRSAEKIEQTTATRVANLKKKYPDWLNDVIVLRNHFESNRTKRLKSNRNLI